jgi:hypothetical protein
VLPPTSISNFEGGRGGDSSLKYNLLSQTINKNSASAIFVHVVLLSIFKFLGDPRYLQHVCIRAHSCMSACSCMLMHVCI